MNLGVEGGDLAVEDCDLGLSRTHEGCEVRGPGWVFAFVEGGDGEEQAGRDGDGEDSGHVAGFA